MTNAKNFLLGALAGFAIGANLFNLLHITYSDNLSRARITSEQVEPGCIPTVGLRLRKEDYNHNGKYEPVFTIEDQDYLLMYNSRNEPELVKFTVEQPRIVPQTQNMLENRVNVESYQGKEAK